MDKAQLKQLGVIVAIVILALILLPFITGLIGLAIKVVLFLAVVYGLYWAYETYLKK
ncbi:hypothetical protein [Lacticaseibacillus daqingensis]|uniref:hypothetical protein n=1 Tax=Lacticaseibacillus daqingensis TaxID=2486014 RepID=UPI0013DE47C4|nr:hypothetical protein [Lacticaseibacillus daqingensis]